MTDPTTMPRLAAPVERTITGAPATDTAAVNQSQNGHSWFPFADDGDE